MGGPPTAAVEGDDQRLIAIEGIDHVQARVTGDRDGRGQRVGEAEVGSGHARRGGPRDGLPRMRIDEVVAALVGTRGGDRPGEIDDLGQTPRREGIGDAGPEGLAVAQAAEARDVPGRVHDRARNAAGPERAERPLRRPPLHVSGRVDPSGHGPRIEPPPGKLARDRAQLEDLGYLGRGLRDGDLPAPQPADRAVRLPRAEHGVRPLELGPGRRQLPGKLAGISAAGINAGIGVDVDVHHRAHHVLEVVNRVLGRLSHR